MKDESSNDIAMKSAFKSQYYASLDMLRQTIENCPEDLWYSTEYKNAFWQVAYHTLFFTHLYLYKTSEDFVPWEKHQEDNQNPDGIGGKPDPESKLPLIPTPYSKEDLLEYCQYCKGLVDKLVDDTDLENPESGFSWYNVSKFEHQLVNLRHLQHGAAQLADRLRNKLDVGTRWVGRGKLSND